MNLINNPKTMTRIWAGLYCDFEKLMSAFMVSKGWRYVHFANICRDMKITLVLHITQGRGKIRDEHYYLFTNMILQLCKEFWLRTDSEKETPEAAGSSSTPSHQKSMADEAMELKRSLGGFYLLYTLFENQPIKGRVKIAMGIDDLKNVLNFIERIKVLPFSKEVAFMLSYLEVKNAYHYCIYSSDFGFDVTTRYFANNSKSAVVSLTRKMRDSQDVLAYSTIHKQCEKTFQELATTKNTIARELLKSVNTKNISKHFMGNSAFPMFVKTLTSKPGKYLLQALDKTEELIDRPVVSLQTLTATEAIDRVMSFETRKRMERALRKASYYSHDADREGRGRGGKGYVREGGIFGRKKEVEEGDENDRLKRRERGACSGNLWTYIKGYDFDKPMGDINDDENSKQ